MSASEIRVSGWNLWNAIPLTLYHLGALLVFAVGFSWPAVICLFVTYWLQIFGVSAGYHRYLAHRSFKTSRVFQFVLAFLGATSAQMGPLWWTAHHRRHHQHADTEDDLHSPTMAGFFWSHIGWMLDDSNAETNLKYVKDWARFPELRWLDKHRYVPPAVLGVSCFLAGAALSRWAPEWGANGVQLLVWGMLLSTTLVYQVTFCINSITHMIGSRRYATEDNSRNVWFLALLTNGEGWHNNHHRYPSSERQGFFWYELDMTHYILTVLSWFGVVWDIKGPPASVYASDSLSKR